METREEGNKTNKTQDKQLNDRNKLDIEIRADNCQIDKRKAGY